MTPSGVSVADAASAILAAAQDRKVVTVATVLSGRGAPGGRMLGVGDGREVEVRGSLGDAALDGAVSELLCERGRDPTARDGVVQLRVGPGATEVYVEIHRPHPELLVVGAGHIARPLAVLGSFLGYRVEVLDDRPDFATEERFPEAAQARIVDFSDPFRDVHPGPHTHVVLVTRGHRYDYECLRRLLRMDPGPAYIGMIGSRRRVRATFAKLLEEGISPETVSRVNAPVGLDIGAETPAEIAVSVAAELVWFRHGGTGGSLRDAERVVQRFFSRDEESDEP